MQSSALLLRLTLDLMVEAGISRNTSEAKAYIETKLRAYRAAEPEFAAALFTATAQPAVCPSCPLKDPARLAALDGLAGVFIQASEHFELLAEPPRATMAQ